MKKGMLLLLLFIFAVVFANAQTPKTFTIPDQKFGDTTLFKKFNDKPFIDSLRNALKLRNEFYGNRSLAGAMPKRFNYIGNNGKGFDIYQTPQDNMYILKPDSSFVSNMPVAKGYDAYTKAVEMPNGMKERRE